MALRGQIINDTQPFCSVREQNHIVGRHTHTNTHHYSHRCSSASVVAVTLAQAEAVLWLGGQSLCISTLYAILRRFTRERNVQQSEGAVQLILLCLKKARFYSL